MQAGISVNIGGLLEKNPHKASNQGIPLRTEIKSCNAHNYMLLCVFQSIYAVNQTVSNAAYLNRPEES